MSLLTADYHYHLPESLIASHPLPNRADSRMLVVHRQTQTIEHRLFSDFPTYLKPQDILVLNDTKVIPARLFSDDGKSELLCLEQLSPNLWRCMAKPGKRLKTGRTITAAGITGTIVKILENGDRIIEWETPIDLHTHGHLALPHYMNRDDEALDHDRYQTVFASNEGAIAAPTAGLHFTPEILQTIPHDFITLHVGIGTFRPVKTELITDHHMHSEKFHVTAQTAKRINHAARVIAVGTTVTRVLESLAKNTTNTRIPPETQTGETNIFIHPPYQFRAIDALLTNFHLPQSTLIMLVSALANRQLILQAYHEAVQKKYRFYSYGDCMLIL